MKPVLIFDVNETLLNTHALRPAFSQLFGDPAVVKEWFDALLLYSEAVTLLGDYRNFSVLAEEALIMVASSRDTELSRDQISHVLELMRLLPPHPDVAASLQRLKDAGFRLAALTNSSAEAAKAQLTNAQLYDSFERIMSVEAVRKFKPAPEVYAYACSELRIVPGEALMIAAHPWDLFGAMRSGMRGAFLKRAGKSWFGRSTLPEFTAPDLAELTDRLLALD